MSRVRSPGLVSATRWSLALGLSTLILSSVVSYGQAPVAPAKSDKKVETAPPVPMTAAEAEALAIDKRLIAEGKKGSELMSNLQYLSDIIGPRLTGSAGLKKANEWTAEKMRAYGLSNVKLEPWSIPVGWERGGASAKIVEPPNGRSLMMASAGWSPGTKGKIEGDVVIIKARNTKDLEAYKGKLKNAIVLRGEPATVRAIGEPAPAGGGGPGQGGGRRRPGGAEGDKAGEAKKVDAAPAKEEAKKVDAPVKDAAKRVEKDEKGEKAEAKKTDAPKAGENPFGGRDRGAFGEMMEFRREMAAFMRKEGVAALLQDAGKPQGLLVTTGAWQGEDRASASEPIPTLYVAHEHYALLHRLANRPEPAKTRVQLEVTNTFVPGPVVVYNTVGEIQGSEKPDEFVILVAHLDSWDLAQGTTDNGTGSSVVMEAARIIAKSGVKPRRTIRFLLVSGEEQGLHGSREYVKSHKSELDKISMVVAHDTGTGKVQGVGLQGRAAIKPIFEKELVSLKELGAGDINLRSMGGTDHQSFERQGVPGFALQQDMSTYYLTHHTQSDTFDKAKEPDLVAAAQIMAVMAMRVANLPELLPRAK